MQQNELFFYLEKHGAEGGERERERERERSGLPNANYKQWGIQKLR